MKKPLFRIVTIAAFYYVLLLANACKRSMPVPADYAVKSHIIGVEISNVVFVYENDSTYYSSSALNDSATFNEFGIGIRPLLKELALRRPSFSLCNTALAVMAKNYTVLLDTAENLRVRTLRDFDASHLAGADVTDYFNYLSKEIKSSKSTLVKVPVPGILSDLNTNRWQSLLLVKKPELDAAVQFELSLQLTNGTVFKDTTSLILIK